MQRSLKRALTSTLALAAVGAVLAGAVALGTSCLEEELSPVPISAGSSSASGVAGSIGSAGGDEGTGGQGFQRFTPSGCSFSIARRPEYLGFSLGTFETAPAPNIRRVRLGLGGNVAAMAPGRADPSTTMAFAWQTDVGTLASDVAWGADPDPAKWPADSRARGVTWLTPPGEINGSGPEQMHEAYVCGLKPATTYYYRVGGGAAGSEVWSEVYSFTTTPSDPGATVKIGVAGDSRGELGDAWRLTQRRMQLAGVDLELFSGDIAGAGTDQAAWGKWLDAAWRDADSTPLTLAEKLILPAHGNHENHAGFFFSNLVLPEDSGQPYGKYAELFFSIDVGPAHIIVLDDAWIANPDMDPGYAGVLAGWLKADLDAAVKNRANVPWIITVQHRPEYSSSAHGKDADVLRVRDYFVPIWDQYHVDLALRGHDHNYERTKPLTGPASNPTAHDSPADGTVYVGCAGAGAPAYSPGVSPFTAVSHGYQSGGAVGVYGILTVSRGALTLEARELRGDGSDPVVDVLKIVK